MDGNDFSKTLEQLEGNEWGEPTFDSNLIIKVHLLRKIPISEFSNEDLRLMIIQRLSLHYLLPLAFSRFVQNPLSSGNLFLGDLLSAVLQIEEEFWNNNQTFKFELDEILDTYEDAIKTINEHIRKYRKEIL